MLKWEELKTIKICLKKDYQAFLVKPQLPESKKNFENTRMKKIREDFNKLTNPFLKPKIKEIRKNL